jgi:hypothetical protein
LRTFIGPLQGNALVVGHLVSRVFNNHCLVLSLFRDTTKCLVLSYLEAC